MTTIKTAKIKTKNSNISNKVPRATDLEVGELAVNLADKKLFSKEPGNKVIEIELDKDVAIISWEQNKPYSSKDLVGYQGKIYSALSSIPASTSFKPSLWHEIGDTGCGLVCTGTRAPTKPSTNDLWFNVTTNQLNKWNGSHWVPAIGVAGPYTDNAAAKSAGLVIGDLYHTPSKQVRIVVCTPVVIQELPVKYQRGYKEVNISTSFEESSYTFDIDWREGPISRYNLSGEQVKHTYKRPLINSSVKIMACKTKKFLYLASTVGAWQLTTNNFNRDLTTISMANDIAMRISGDVINLPRELKVFNITKTSSTMSGNVANLPTKIEKIYMKDTRCAVSGKISDLPATMNVFSCHRTVCALTGVVSDLPTGMLSFECGANRSSITGAVTDLPAGIQCYSVYNSQSCTLSGDIADLPAGITVFNVAYSRSRITAAKGTLGIGINTIIKSIDLDDTNLRGSTVDDIIIICAKHTKWAPASILKLGGRTNVRPGFRSRAAIRTLQRNGCTVIYV